MKEPLDPPTIRYTVTETSLRLIFEQIIWNGVLKKIYLSTYIQDPRSKSIVYNDLNSFTHRFHQCVEFPDGSTNYPPANQRELPRSKSSVHRRGTKKRQRGRSSRRSGRFPATRRVNMESRQGFEKGGRKMRETERNIYIYIPFVPGAAPRERRRCGRRPAFSPAEFPFAPTRPPPRSFSPHIAGCPRASRPTPSSSASFSSSSRPNAPSAS